VGEACRERAGRPDTWEVALSGGANKRETFERLIREGQLGYLALLRNLRNMAEAGCDVGLCATPSWRARALSASCRSATWPRLARRRSSSLRLTKRCPEAIAGLPVLPGKTAILVDVSGSMDASFRRVGPEAHRRGGGSGLDHPRRCAGVHVLASGGGGPARRGMAGIDAVIRRSRTAEPTSAKRSRDQRPNGI
jgi:60 kDa SS-A/Ro ribonucleoprotein